MTFKTRTISGVAEDELGSDVEKNAKESNGVKKEYNGKMEKVETLKCFLMDTTLHGARFAFAECLLRRFLWNLAILASFAFCSYQAYWSWRQYFQRPFNTRITSKSALESGLTYPAVTLCNLNPQNIQRIVYLHSHYSREAMKQKRDDISKLLQLSNVVVADDILERNPEFFDREKHVVLWKLHSHQIEEMLLPNVPPSYTPCSFDGLLCGAKNFTSFTSSSFGQCFTFNSGQNGSQLLKARMAGKNYGLKLRLNIQRDGYIKFPKNPFVGITVFVHDQDNFPFMDEFGLAVQPGKHTFLSIKKKRVGKLKCFSMNIDFSRLFYN